LRILDVEEVKTVPYAPLSHPFVERLIGTIRRECLDRTLFWTAADLERKLFEFQCSYNGYRVHAGLAGRPPASMPNGGGARASLGSYRWQPHSPCAVSHADRSMRWARGIPAGTCAIRDVSLDGRGHVVAS